MSTSSPAFKVFGYGIAPEAPAEKEHKPYDDTAVRELLAEHERRIDTLESLTASFEEAMQPQQPLLPNIHDILADKMRELRAAGSNNNYEADDLKLCAEFAAHAAEGDANAIQALTPLAIALGVSVDVFIDQELSRESARRTRVFQIRAAEIAFRKRIEAATTFDDLTEIRTAIEAFTI